MRALFRIDISDQRAKFVFRDIKIGSEPQLRFYAMVAASTAIATFGLIKNSTAIVIGAMLVAPLMTPIFGIALGLVRGDATLLGRALRAEIEGVILTMGLAACFGYLMPALEATPEMLDRTSPNLLDLLVAVFAGFAGAYAMVDEHISPALPGGGHRHGHRSTSGKFGLMSIPGSLSRGSGFLPAVFCWVFFPICWVTGSLAALLMIKP